MKLSTEDIVVETATWLDARGVPVDRLSTSLRAMHPEVYVRNVTWTRGEGPRVTYRTHAIIEGPSYRNSPVARIHEGAKSVRVDLRNAEAARGFEVCQQLRDEGFTDYLALPLQLLEVLSYASFATRCEDGFSPAQIALLEEAMATMTQRLALAQEIFVTESLLQVYLGPNAAGRVLAGAVKRGTGETIRAAIWTCDLRGFTTLADSRPPADVVRVLDRYFDAVGEPIERGCGEILKFIGDAVLAIFPVKECGDEKACERAITAAEQAIERLAEASERSVAEGGPALALGIALHLGDVFYGNVGASRRLDFTVIGAAVNEVSRVEPLCKTCGVPLLVTDTFREALPGRAFASQGSHALRGASKARELFTLPRFAS